MTRSFLAGVALTCLFVTPLAAEPAKYATPFDALDGMINALETTDRAAILTVFGPESEGLISSGNAEQDKRNRASVLELHAQGYRMELQQDGSFVIALGSGGWPFPVPLTRSDDGWSFDAVAGREEIDNRTLGLNEIEVIELLEAYVGVQSTFRLEDQNGDGVMEFARQIISTAEDRNGLFWPGTSSPMGERLARAAETGFNDGQTNFAPEPYLGYYFKILTRQGDNAPGGEMNYLVNGNMVGGHALLAVPADYGTSGVHSFLVSENGVIMQMDMGEETLETAVEIGAYDPGPDWELAQ